MTSRKTTTQYTKNTYKITPKTPQRKNTKSDKKNILNETQKK